MDNIYELSERANEVCELNYSDTRYWIQKLNGEERHFICNNSTEMDDINEVSKKKFVSRIKRFLK